MFSEAVKNRLIPFNPATNVKRLKDEERDVEIFTPAEVRKIFSAEWPAIWTTEIGYMANKIAACTGMRIGEVLGLRGEHIYDDYIHVVGQYTRTGYGPTKTRTKRKIPITAQVRRELDGLLKLNGNGYIFSTDGGASPVGRYQLVNQLEEALRRVEISDDERKRRKITFHTWRHFFNTMLRTSGITDAKVQAIVGHTNLKMTDHYTHFNVTEFTDVKNVLETFLVEHDKKVPVKQKTEMAS